MLKLYYKFNFATESFIVSKKINNSNYRVTLTFLMFLHSSTNQCYNMINKNSSVNTPIPSLLP
ncbi:hypothetical protein DP18_2778 [Staphylococcus aureus]|nr:hypothetical protein DP18_2778 [Staphylococcus aureus]